jgi:pimeloyl-ACP methyl ester carboxylesterase
VTLNVVRRGQGSPIVLVHGICSRWQAFEPIIDVLAQHHEVIAIDLPGFGLSPLQDDVVPGPRGYADWLERWLTEQGIKRPHVVGNSMGGGIALELGRRGVAASVTAFSPIGFWGRPGLAWSQVLYKTLRALTGPGARLFRALVRFAPTRAAVTGIFFAHPVRMSATHARLHLDGLIGATGTAQALEGFKGYVLTDGDDPGALPHVPVTIAWADRDLVLTYWTQARRARRILPFVGHVVLPSAGHVPFEDNPSACVDAILSTVAHA